MKRRAMGRGVAPHRVVELSPQRQVVLTFLDLSSWNHYMFAILDVDVTLASHLIDCYEARTGSRCPSPAS